MLWVCFMGVTLVLSFVERLDGNQLGAGRRFSHQKVPGISGATNIARI